jgi:ribosomal protein L11 methyltransferase
MKPTPTNFWFIKVRVPNKVRVVFERALEPFCLSVTSIIVDSKNMNGNWDIEGISRNRDEVEAVQNEFKKVAKITGINPAPKPEFNLVTPRDWVAENQANFPPLIIGRYFIYGSHFKDLAPISSIKIRLNAGTAFGSGKHPSTAGCLKALDLLARRYRFQRPLDMGCGSGILALAIAKTWRVRVVACDIEEEAARVTTANAKLNNIKKLLLVCSGASYKSPTVVQGRPYDLIATNILSRPLKAMSRNLFNSLSPGGVAILSGLLRRDSKFVIQAHLINGLKLVQIIQIEDWVTIVMKR